VILFLSTADTDLLAVSRAAAGLPAGFPEVRAANPTRLEDGAPVPGAARVVLVRLLGGRRAWQGGSDRLAEACKVSGVPLLAFGGEVEPDAELAAASTAPAGVVAQAFEYLRHGGVANMEHLLRFVADTLLYTGFGFEPPAAQPEVGLYRPELARRRRLGRPTVGVVFYRAHWMSGNTAFVDTLVEALEAAGANPLPVFCYSLRPDSGGSGGRKSEAQAGAPGGQAGPSVRPPVDPGRIPACELLAEHGVDALIVTVLASGGSGAADALAGAGSERPDDWLDWQVPALEALDVPIVQGICATSTRAGWLAAGGGLSPLDAAMQVAIPEFDGRIIGVPFSFKEPAEAGGQAMVYRADPERAARLAAIASRLARLRHVPNRDKRVAIVLSNYPTKQARVGNAVGLDTPASAVRLLEAMRAAGYQVGDLPGGAGGSGGAGSAKDLPGGAGDLPPGDRLVHALIAAGGHDTEFLTSEQLAGAAARVDAATYAAWFRTLPSSLREAVLRHWGEPPGDLYVDGDAVVLAGLRLGNLFLAIQPPRGFGENPTAIYHDPDLPPSHHYLAAYWWLDRVFRADAIVHLGKHGTLEWLPGKSLALSAACAPDAVLGAVPLVYPFIVNDPGEGTQAKRRAHAVIVDHLVPPMQRAETYDELARLEQLLDEHAAAQALDPAKLPAIRARIWELVRAAELHRDLGMEGPPSDFDQFVLHLDGYLCEIKDARIRDGLHVLGSEPLGEQRLGLLAAILRLGSGREVPGLRRAVAAAFGLDELSLLECPGLECPGRAAAGRHPAVPDPCGGSSLPPRPPKSACAPPALDELLQRFPGPGVTAADVVDRLEEAAMALLAAMEDKGWEVAAVGAVAADVLGSRGASVVRTLEFAAREVVPRLARTSDEIASVLRALEGRFVPAGPSGSPTRGLVNVLPTGRNFYSVDPKALPSELSHATGERLADDLLRRYLDDEGAYPETIGIVVWGTSAMRTGGDDIGEVLALLGVRPVWNPESRRVTGLEVVPLEALGRPRVDVTVRISGFFRDAFPNLVAMLDDAVTMVAGLDEPDELNFVAKHARAERDAGAAWRRATTRVFGSKPGAYGAGLLPLIDARNWRSQADLVEVYEVWGGYAYGRGLDGMAAVEAMRANLARVRAVVKNVDTYEHDLLDSDDYFQYHGGMVAAVRATGGRDPRAYLGDSADPARVRTRGLDEEVRRVVRARVVNPRWIASMARHGYKGAFELAATVDYLFGYDATTGVVEDWMYQAVAERYVLDETTATFMRRSNPWALRAIAERLLEAADRGLWTTPSERLFEQLRSVYLELEGELEERQWEE
jgi:cobaltochelatase CobN